MYGLIGKKLGHSFSDEFFNQKFAHEGINESYHLFPINEISLLPSLIENEKELKGLNVTIPYKTEVIPYLTSLSKEAEAIGAVNVIKIIRKSGDVILRGFNTDCEGFEHSLLGLLVPNTPLFEIQGLPLKALILGTGGASKAVAYVLDKLNIPYQFVSRHPQERQLSYNDLDKKIVESHLLIINTTPLGMYPEISAYPPIPYHYLTTRHICFDLVYNPEETEFLMKAKKKGATVKNGLEMLYGQALAAWNIWNNPDQ